MTAAEKGWAARLVGGLIDRVGRQTDIPFAVTFTNGYRYLSPAAAGSPPAFEFRFRAARGERRAALFGHVGLLDAYFDGELDIGGDLRALFRAALYSGSDSPNVLVRLRNHWHEWRHSNHSRVRAKANARAHYGLGTDFYRLWLDDPLMMYTCAYWAEGTRTLEDAQRAKVEHVCRKIRLAPDESVVDIGCGFGGFMFHAANQHRARVTGVNTTTEQVEALRERIERRGLADRLNVVETDFRDAFAQFDKMVSIGVLEHAGRDQVDEVIAAHARFTKPGGLGLIHFIGHLGRHDTEFFIRDHVFPGGWIPALSEVIESLERHGLEVLEIENLRRHYALTLDAWLARFDANWPIIHALDPRRFDERFRRIWRVYLLGCAEMFRSEHGGTHLFQITVSRGNVSSASYPMTRRFLYRNDIVETAPATPAPSVVASLGATLTSATG